MKSVLSGLMTLAVTGMIVTFQAITLFGTGDPKLMAGGISQALVTTVLGLTVAIPLVLLHTLVSGRSKRILQILQEQSAGIVAERSGAALSKMVAKNQSILRTITTISIPTSIHLYVSVLSPLQSVN